MMSRNVWWQRKYAESSLPRREPCRSTTIYRSENLFSYRLRAFSYDRASEIHFAYRLTYRIQQYTVYHPLARFLRSVMADYSFGGSDEENAELKKLNAEVVCLSQRLISNFSALLIQHTARGAR